MDLLSKLKKWKKKSITKGELENLFGAHSDVDLFSLVQEAVKKGALTPVNKKVTNGNYLYPIHMKYHLMISRMTGKMILMTGMRHSITGKMRNNALWLHLIYAKCR